MRTQKKRFKTHTRRPALSRAPRELYYLSSFLPSCLSLRLSFYSSGSSSSHRRRREVSVEEATSDASKSSFSSKPSLPRYRDSRCSRHPKARVFSCYLCFDAAAAAARESLPLPGEASRAMMFFCEEKESFRKISEF